MKVSELEGALLDYWVSRAEGKQACVKHTTGGFLKPDAAHPGPGRQYPVEAFDPAYPIINEDRCYLLDGERRTGFWLNYSIDWDMAGPIIEGAGINLLELGGVWAARLSTTGGIWSAGTPLVAAMRAYVASKFGDEVPDLPDTV